MRQNHFFRRYTNGRPRSFLVGTLSLTASGLFCRLLGFAIRIFLSRTVGAKGMGLLQLSLVVFGIGVSFSAMGIQSALSKLAADYAQKSPDQETFLLRSALILSLSLAILTGSLFFFGADFIAGHFLQEIRCAPLIRMFSFALPFCCIHACYNGFFYANSQTRGPALSQLAEQLTRAGTLFFIWLIKIRQSATIELADVVFATILSEASAAFFVWCSRLQTKIRKRKRTVSYLVLILELTKISTPICINRLSQTFVTALESVLIPICLRRFGLSDVEALSVFGVLTAMAMPFILFPSILTGSMAVLLLPKVASAHTAQNQEKLLYYSRSAILFSLGLGCVCTAFFYLSGPFLGNLFFHSISAGLFIRKLSLLCPFLYLGITCGSILNGLGKSSTVLIHTLLSFALRIGGAALLIPIGGIGGYLLGLLTSELLLCTLHLSSIRKALATMNDIDSKTDSKINLEINSKINSEINSNEPSNKQGSV